MIARGKDDDVENRHECQRPTKKKKILLDNVGKIKMFLPLVVFLCKKSAITTVSEFDWQS